MSAQVCGHCKSWRPGRGIVASISGCRCYGDCMNPNAPRYHDSAAVEFDVAACEEYDSNPTMPKLTRQKVEFVP